MSSSNWGLIILIDIFVDLVMVFVVTLTLVLSLLSRCVLLVFKMKNKIGFVLMNEVLNKVV